VPAGTDLSWKTEIGGSSSLIGRKCFINVENSYVFEDVIENYAILGGLSLTRGFSLHGGIDGGTPQNLGIQLMPLTKII
jgi:hypothetical protein